MNNKGKKLNVKCRWRSWETIIYIYVSILCMHLSNRYRSNDVYIVSPSITTTCMVPMIFAQCERKTPSSGEKKQKEERNTKEKEK
jgi:hypothetical protein